jgi:hypothetical protein
MRDQLQSLLAKLRFYGMASALDVELARAEREGAKQQNLRISRMLAPKITVDNIEVAQFIYLLLRNDKIRHVMVPSGMWLELA